MTALIGHFHPLLVHLPIGILLLAFALECMARFGQSELRPAIRRALLFGLIAAIFSALSGWAQAENGAYDAELLEPHRWLGVATVGLFALVCFLRDRKGYFAVFSAGVLALVVTGHYGGSLTHGDDYVFEKQAIKKISVDEVKFLNPETIIFRDLVQPILKEKCVTCHRPEKRKGGLLLDTEEGIFSGGKSGRAIIPGQPDSSLLLKRIHLPLQDDHHMPPAGKAQLSTNDVRLIEWWIAQDADVHATLATNPLPAELLSVLNNAEASINPVFSQPVSSATTQNLARLKALKINVQSLGAGQPWLSVSLAGQRKISTACWQALEAVSEQITELDLSHTALRDQDLKGKNFPHLTRLNLAHTSAATVY